MYPFQIRYTADDRAAVSIHDLYFRVVRDEEATRGGIECDVVPVFLAPGRSAEVVSLQQVVAAIRGICEGKTSEQQDGTARSEATQIRKLHRKTSAEVLAATLNLGVCGRQHCAYFIWH